MIYFIKIRLIFYTFHFIISFFKFDKLFSVCSESS